MAKKLTGPERLLDNATNEAASQYAEVDAYMRSAMAHFTKGSRSGNQLEMQKGHDMALNAVSACMYLRQSLQEAANLMKIIAREK